MGFFSSVFGGSDPTTSAGIKQAGQTSKYANTLGQKLTTQAGDFMSTIMGGNPAQIAKLLAPQIQTQQNQVQQAKQGMAQFGNRSGGVNAKSQTLDDTGRANISNMISDMTSKAAGASASMGQGLIDTGLSALNQQVQFSQDQMANWNNSIFGNAMSTGAGMAMSAIPMGA